MIVAKKDLDQALLTLSRDALVFAPLIDVIEDESKVGEPVFEKKFAPYYEGARVALEGYNTVKPPKDILFPNVEKMYKYKTGEDAYIEEIIPEDRQKILFGVRPCDMRSIDSMDQVFLTKEYVDSYYAKRREMVTIVAIGCIDAQRTCFCDSMGIDPNHAPTADVMMNITKSSERKTCEESGGKVLDEDGSYILEALTEKGQVLLDKLAKIGKEDNAEEAYKEMSCTLKIQKDPQLDKKLSKMFAHPIWDKVTKGCIGCGTCTFVCPTCYCFDIDNENYGAQGCKYRCWDSCMFSDYTRMAGGADPRPTKKERLRNRYMHKLSYFQERYGQTLCVGCGRCIDNCPAHLDISEFIEKASAVDVNADRYSEADFAEKEVR